MTRGAIPFFGVRADRRASIEDLARKSTCDGASRVQKLRHPDDVAGEEKQSLGDIKGFAGRCEFRLLHTDANEMLKAHCIGHWALGFGH